MKTREASNNDEIFSMIRLPEEGIPNPRLRLYISIIVTVFIAILIFIDQSFGVWPIGVYWILFFLGVVVSCLFIGVVLLVNDRRRSGNEGTWLERFRDEIGWSLMILAFTIQFLFPQIRPFLLGAILAGSWLIVLWYRRKMTN